MKPAFKRILLKLSGEALLGEKNFGIDYDVLHKISEEIAEIHSMGVEIVIVIGAGNIWRGRDNQDSGIDPVSSDYIGMLATIMNGVALQASLENRFKIETRVMSALAVPAVSEQYIKRRAMRHLGKSRICICVAGTGNPYFTTDSAAALRSLELECDILLKGTNVDGVYSADPQKDPTAKKYDKISFHDVLEKELRVMDSTAIAQCRDNQMPLLIFPLMEKGALEKAVCKEKIGTIVS